MLRGQKRWVKVAKHLIIEVNLGGIFKEKWKMGFRTSQLKVEWSIKIRILVKLLSYLFMHVGPVQLLHSPN